MFQLDELRKLETKTIARVEVCDGRQWFMLVCTDGTTLHVQADCRTEEILVEPIVGEAFHMTTKAEGRLNTKVEVPAVVKQAEFRAQWANRPVELQRKQEG